MKKARMLVMVLLVAVAVMFVGCGGNDDAQQNQGQQNQQQEQQQQEGQNQGSQEQQNQENTVNDDAQNVQADVELVTLTGQFNGLADNHSVEVNVDGEATVFQFSDEDILAKLEIMEEGTEIQFDAEFETGTNIRRMVKLYE